MPEEKSAAKDVAEGVKSVLDRIGEFFHIFDLSFFVAGAVTFGALAFLYVKTGAPRDFPFANWVGVGAVVVTCYAAGLMSFTIGRLINGRLFRLRKFPRKFQQALERHGVTGGEVGKYLGEVDHLWWLYMRMWQDVAYYRPKSVAFQHLSRYWVMSATYDGLAASFLAWAVVAVLSTLHAVTPEPISATLGYSAAVVFLLLSVTALKQAADYYSYQIEDLVAAAVTAKAPVF